MSENHSRLSIIKPQSQSVSLWLCCGWFGYAVKLYLQYTFWLFVYLFVCLLRFVCSLVATLNVSLLDYDDMQKPLNGILS